MKYFEILLETKKGSIEDYLSIGMDKTNANKYFNANIPLNRAIPMYKEQQHWKNDENDGFDTVLKMEKSYQRQQKEEKAFPRFISSLPSLLETNIPLTHIQACALIAYDDSLFNAIYSHTSNVDFFEENPESAERILQIIDRVKPFQHPPLYRGQCSYNNLSHSRKFHSWTLAKDTAEIFYRDCSKDTGQLLMITCPVKAIRLSEVGDWRMRIKNESVYIASQEEWLVLDGYPYKVIDKK